MQYVRLCILTAHYLHRALESINKLSAGPFLAVEETARGVRCQLKFKRLLSIQCSTPETAVSLNWPVTRLYLSQQQTHTHSDCESRVLLHTEISEGDLLQMTSDTCVPLYSLKGHIEKTLEFFIVHTRSSCTAHSASSIWHPATVCSSPK